MIRNQSVRNLLLFIMCGSTMLVAQTRSGEGVVASTAWRVPGEGRGRPAVDASSSYFVSKHHEVFAFNLANGMQRWRSSTGQSTDATMGTESVLTGGLLIVGDSGLVAFDRDRGTVRWTFAGAAGGDPGVYLGDAVSGAVFAGSSTGYVYAVDARGSQRWTTSIDPGGPTTVFKPVASEGEIIAGYTTFTQPHRGGMVALDPVTGREQWRIRFPLAQDPTIDVGFAGGPVLSGALVLAASGDGTIYAIDRANGAIVWSIPQLTSLPADMADLATRDFRPLAISGRQLIAGSLMGYVAAYDLGTREERWRYGSLKEGSVAFTLASDDTTVYVPYYSGRLVALNVKDGKERWRTTDPDNGFVWQPLPVGNRVFAAASLTGFYAFNR